MQTVAIVGVGLIGASFGLAIRKAGFNGPILGVSSAAAIQAGLNAGAITGEVTLHEAAERADLIYLAQPVDRILDTLRLLGDQARKETLVTDAGSTKAAIVDCARAHLQHATFIGGHPMAGKETRGAQSADADLFRGRPYALTPEVSVPAEFRSLLIAIGANVIEMTAEEHDATVALTSHLPQLVSTSLAAFLSKQSHIAINQVFGSGLLDMTRLALSPIDLWSSILATNRANVALALQLYAASLDDLKRSLESDTLHQTFADAAQFAGNLRNIAH